MVQMAVSATKNDTGLPEGVKLNLEAELPPVANRGREPEKPPKWLVDYITQMVNEGRGRMEFGPKTQSEITKHKRFATRIAEELGAGKPQFRTTQGRTSGEVTPTATIMYTVRKVAADATR